MKTTARADGVALSAAALLVGATLLELLWPHHLAVAPPAPVRADAPARTEHTAAYPAHSVLDHMAQRPLFTVDRRPYEPPPSAENSVPAGARPPTIDAALVGIAKAADERLILVQLGATSVVHRLRVGGQIEGWTVTSIGDANATLSSNGHHRELSLVSGIAR